MNFAHETQTGDNVCWQEIYRTRTIEDTLDEFDLYEIEELKKKYELEV